MTENEEVKEEIIAETPVEETVVTEETVTANEPVEETVEDSSVEVNVEAIKQIKEITSLVKEKNYKDASKKAATLSKALYDKHLKGKYVEVKGKKIPLTAVVIAAVFLFFYIIWPSSAPVKPAQAPKAQITKITPTTAESAYDKDGLKVYDLSKCDKAVCGKVENNGENTFKSVVISVSFFDDKGELIYEGGVEAADVVPNSRMNLNIPTEGEFATFKLKEVVATK